MASKGKKKAVNKDDLRRMMKQHGSSKNATKRIDSPLAKYNSIGQLVCIVCQSQVKSEILWNAHLQGRSHKENMEKMKRLQEKAETSVPRVSGGILKRKSGDVSSVQNKVLKNNSSKTATSLGLGGYSSSEEEETDNPKASTSKSNNSLPADFFDNSTNTEKDGSNKDTEHEEEAKPKAMSEQLPEGFFDDPKQDAKIRQIEYKNKMDEEWELFQKSMKEETTVSEQIREVDDEQATVERNIDEIDEQIHRWSKINSLQEKKEKLMEHQTEDKKAEIHKETDSESEFEDENFDSALNWRAKSVK